MVRGGTVHEGKGIIFPQSKAALPATTEKDLRDLEFGKRMGVAFVALSFVRSAADVADLRRRLGKHDIGIISKIETREAIVQDSTIADRDNRPTDLKDDGFGVPVLDTRSRDYHPCCRQTVYVRTLYGFCAVRCKLVTDVIDHLLNCRIRGVKKPNPPLNIFPHLLRSKADPTIE